MPFVKGQSGNPRGRPKGAAGVAAYVASQTDDCRELIDRLLALSRDSKTPVRERLAATEIVLSRAIGRSMQPSELRLEIDGQVNVAAFAALAPADRLRALDDMRARRALGAAAEADTLDAPDTDGDTDGDTDDDEHDEGDTTHE